MKVVAFNGSARKEGNTDILIKAVLAEVEKEGIDTEIVNLRNSNIQGCKACGKCFEKQNQRCVFKNDIANDCIEKMLSADGVLLGSPTYFTDVSTEMKALIDRAGYVAKANNDMFQRKVGASVVAVRRAGSNHVFTTMNNFFLISQMIIPGSSYWNMGIGLDKGDVRNDEEGMTTMKVLGTNMAWLMKQVAKG